MLEAEIIASKTENYSQLWLQYRPVEDGLRDAYRAVIQHVCCRGDSALLRNAGEALQQGASVMTGSPVARVTGADRDGTVMLGTLENVRSYLPEDCFGSIRQLGPEGYAIESICCEGRKSTLITSGGDAGVLYGVFHFLRLMQAGKPIEGLCLRESPAAPLRMLNHWDDLNGYIERGYAGRSLWEWEKLPETVSPRYRDHARLCASLGINALVLNNVNADPRILRADYLEKVAVLAGIFREWGIQTYLSANFGAPMRPSDTPDKMKRWGGIGNLDTADPLDPQVEAWWTAKVNEIYALIPDFGGFLVKADSEGMPGPRKYKRTHIEGANMLARALKPQGGNLIWRAFVYGSSDDRARDAYDEFTPLDGQFLDNVILQIKNGPLDFQPCEPFTPLFGDMPQTRLSLEVQIAKEYLGHAASAAYMGPMWKEILQTDTYAEGEGSSIARMLKGELQEHRIECIAGVTNTGDEPGWCGHVLNPANWYAFGRLAWNPDLAPAVIAEEWTAMTFSCGLDARQIINEILMKSYDALVNYSMPLGLNFLCDWNHYDPKPEMRAAYHHADRTGLGVDRTATGSKAVEQYHPERAAIWADREQIPLQYLLWFHHVPWHDTLPTGRSLWAELKARYAAGVAAVDEMLAEWMKLEEELDPAIYKAGVAKFEEEQRLARNWSDACLQYFAQFAESESEGEIESV
ncbi:MAG: alpha-glucuronidase family glycosyl hydrolase [Kiritimatiellia bacterium]